MVGIFVNEQPHDVDVDVDVANGRPLFWLLRSDLNLKGTKYGCGVERPRRRR